VRSHWPKRRLFPALCYEFWIYNNPDDGANRFFDDNYVYDFAKKM
jgi:hypothetical protein